MWSSEIKMTVWCPVLKILSARPFKKTENKKTESSDKSKPFSNWLKRQATLTRTVRSAVSRQILSQELKLAEIKIASAPFQVQAIDKNAPGVTCSSSTTLGKLLLLFALSLPLSRYRLLKRMHLAWPVLGAVLWEGFLGCFFSLLIACNQT